MSQSEGVSTPSDENPSRSPDELLHQFDIPSLEGPDNDIGTWSFLWGVLWEQLPVPPLTTEFEPSNPEPYEKGGFWIDKEVDAQALTDAGLEEAGPCLYDRTYTIGDDIGPYRIEQQIQGEIVRFGMQHLTDDELLEFAAGLVADGESTDTVRARQWYEQNDPERGRDSRCRPAEISPGNLSPDHRPTEQVIETYWDQMLAETSPERAVRNAATGQLLDRMERKAVDQDEAYRQHVDRLKRMLVNYDPDVYRGLVSDDREYRITGVTREPQIQGAAEALRTCMRRNGSFPDWYDAEEYATDPFTFIHIVNRGREPAGYVRSFVLQDQEDRHVLGIDTVEVQDGQHRENDDVIRAGALGAIRFGLDLGVAYIVGRHARTQFGPDQGYGHTPRSLEYRKLGDPVGHFRNPVRDDDGTVVGWDIEGFNAHDPDSGTAYLLMENPVYPVPAEIP
ncbi:MAG: hypothetical protein SVW77_03750 [Candidatus Nanohaloarchaea archaeon]|nr:hypothetical protein [Candidatus Nanohaloarchaea archaeon]